MAKSRPSLRKADPSTSLPDFSQEVNASQRSIAHRSESSSGSTRSSHIPAAPAEDPAVHSPRAEIQDELLVEEVGRQWIRIRWSISRKTLERANSAMGRDAHRSVRTLRVLQVEHDDSGPRSQQLVQEIPLAVEDSEWFVHHPASEHACLIEIGVLFGQRRFFSMLHSAPLTLSGNRKPLAESQKFLGGERFLETLEAREPPSLKVQGKFVMNGVTRPGARAVIDDQPVEVCPHTGKFEWELPLANGRIVIPMNVSDCGKVQRALMAIDLNFHLLEPEPGPED